MTTPLTHAEIEGLLGAYALDAVDGDEREAVELHLQPATGPPQCRVPRDRSEVGVRRCYEACAERPGHLPGVEQLGQIPAERF